MSLDQPGLLIGILTVILGIFSLLNSFGVAWIERRIARRAKAADLYDDYYSAENYRRVVLPITRIALKWRTLPEGEREAYRDAVRRGWLIKETPPRRLLESFVDAEELGFDADRAHFHEQRPSDAFTEHEALTVFLYFWTKVYEMILSDVVERKTAKRLLKRPYEYTRSFVQELREDIQDHAHKGNEPVWVRATLGLEKMFN